MQYHDDGEKELDDLVSTWSLGAPAEMFFRIKKKDAHPYLDVHSYDPHAEVVMGSDFWAERMSLNDSYKRGFMNIYRADKAAFFDANRAKMNKDNFAPWCLRLNLSHGDFVVMHGAKIHAAYEVCQLRSNIRFTVCAVDADLFCLAYRCCRRSTALCHDRSLREAGVDRSSRALARTPHPQTRRRLHW